MVKGLAAIRVSSILYQHSKKSRSIMSILRLSINIWRWRILTPTSLTFTSFDISKKFLPLASMRKRNDYMNYIKRCKRNSFPRISCETSYSKCSAVLALCNRYFLLILNWACISLEMTVECSIYSMLILSDRPLTDRLWVFRLHFARQLACVNLMWYVFSNKNDSPDDITIRTHTGELFSSSYGISGREDRAVPFRY